MLTTDPNNTFVVLIRNVEGYRSRHLLLYKVEAVLRSIVLRATDVDIEIVLVEAVKDDLNVA